MKYQQTFIELALAHEALQFGEFTLKSGRQSPYFFNAGLFHSGQALKIVGECYAQAINKAGITFNTLFGPAYKGIPLVCATAIALQDLQHHNYPFTFNRKEAKTHGERGILIGAPLSGKVLIIDDVITAGTAIRESLTLIEAAGAQVAGIVVALDRQERGLSQMSAIQEVSSYYHVPVITLISLQNIVDYIKNHPQFTAHHAALSAYQERYGAPFQSHESVLTQK